MEYMLVRAATYEQFAARVNEAMRDGWAPQGGVSVSHDPTTGDRYFQAVVRDAILGGLEAEAEAEVDDPLAADT